MHGTELLADVLANNLGFLKMTLADFSDADMLTRPCPGGNHAAWQLGHLTVAENSFLNGSAPGKAPELPAGFKEKFSKENSKIDDPKAFPKKDEILDQFTKQRNAMIAWAKSLTPADLDKPGPHPQFAPSIGHLLAMTPVHVAMHVGQFQGIRRKLGKPVLF
jgi:hypothetical protein